MPSVHNQVQAVGNNVKKGELHSISHARPMLRNATRNVLDSALEKKEEIAKKFQEYIGTCGSFMTFYMT